MTHKNHGHAISAPSVNPNADMHMSPAARARMLATEKIVLRYYNDMGKKRGNCTWGPGFLAHKGICSEEELLKKVEAPLISIEYAKRVAEAERAVKHKISIALNQTQFDALCSLTYNAGITGAKDVYVYVNQRDFSGAASAISRMVRVGVTEGGKRKYVLAPGLIRRREEEAAPFRVKAAETAAGK
jgi:GH24 family phage-related lysozyme (muramidase)